MFLTADARPRPAAVQWELRRALLRACRVHGGRCLHVRAVHHPTAVKEIDVHRNADSSARGSSLRSSPRWREPRGRRRGHSSSPPCSPCRSCALAGIAAAIATLAVLVITNVFIGRTALTLGSDTINGVPQTATLGATVVWVVLTIFLAYGLKQSRIGLRLRASRRTRTRRSRSASASAASATSPSSLPGSSSASAGALYAHYFVGFSYTDFYFDLTFIVVAMLVVGGLGSVTGAVVGTFFLTVGLRRGAAGRGQRRARRPATVGHGEPGPGRRAARRPDHPPQRADRRPRGPGAAMAVTRPGERKGDHQ